MRVGSLCTGYGGIELGLTLAGEAVDVRWLAEVDPALAPLHGTTPNIGDIRVVDWSSVEPIDVLAAGFPCQPVSAAGRQCGDADVRWLWPAVFQAVAELQPTHVLIENVRNLVSTQGGRLWSGILDDLASLGYGVRWLTIGACHVGAAHHRHRVIAVAEAGGDHVERVSMTFCGAKGGTVLPTPAARDGDGRGEGDARYWALRNAQRTNGMPLGSAVAVSWERFAEAVARHEAIYGPAPAPTEPNRNGAPRLAPAFAEWLMCLPAGHVTAKLARNDALRAIGNGVCPPQLAAAWRLLTGGAS